MKSTRKDIELCCPQEYIDIVVVVPTVAKRSAGNSLPLSAEGAIWRPFCDNWALIPELIAHRVGNLGDADKWGSGRHKELAWSFYQVPGPRLDTDKHLLSTAWD